MTTEVPIGRLASITGTTVRTLRHYDDVGLLKPARVDPSSGYRYYTVGQAEAVARIRLLRDAGFSISAIAGVLTFWDAGDTDAVRDAVLGHRRRLHAELGSAEDAIARLTSMIDTGRDVMTYDVHVRDVPAIQIASVQTDETTDDVAAFFAGELNALVERLVDAGIHFDRSISLNHDWESDVQDATIESGFIVTAAAGHDVAVRTLEPRRVASVVHSGDDGEIWRAYAALEAWLAQHSDTYALSGPVCTITPLIAGPAREIEVQMPLASR